MEMGNAKAGGTGRFLGLIHAIFTVFRVDFIA